jgi:N-acetylmuramoyl-L-alanine amidase
MVLSLQAISDYQLLKRADSFMKTGLKSDTFRAYNDYKSLYLKALMKDDDKLKLKALKGIVKSGELLHIDVSVYKKELLKSSKTIYKKPKAKKNKPSKNLKNVKLKPSNKLKSVYWIDNSRLVLKFKYKLLNKNINYFKLYDSKKNIYKYVFDIDAFINSSSYKLNKKGIKSIKIAQYKPTKLRLVIENKTVVKVRFKIDRNRLIVKIVPTKEIKNKQIIKKNIYKPIKNKIIVIDPGHGGKDPGAIGYKRYKEKNVVLAIGKYLRDELKKRGYKVYMTRDKDKFIRLSKRTKFANKKKANLFISIHANATSKRNVNKAKGIETYFLAKRSSSRAKKVAEMENKSDLEDMDYYAKTSILNFLNHHLIIKSNKLALDVQSSVLLNLKKHYKGIVDGGVREGPFWVLVGAQMPSILIEVGFITNKKEAKRLVNKRYQKRLAKGIADGIDRYFLKN